MLRLRAHAGASIGNDSAPAGRAAARSARTYAVQTAGMQRAASCTEGRPLAARRAGTACGIKKWLGLSAEDAIGKAGSGCFPDLPVTGYCQTLRGTERSPQKTVMDAARSRHIENPVILPAADLPPALLLSLLLLLRSLLCSRCLPGRCCLPRVRQ